LPIDPSSNASQREAHSKAPPPQNPAQMTSQKIFFKKFLQSIAIRDIVIADCDGGPFHSKLSPQSNHAVTGTRPSIPLSQ
jgi:hypothetical protein